MKAKFLFLLKFIRSRFVSKSRFGIVRGYVHRKKYNYFNDTVFSDEFQDEVYKYAFNYFSKENYQTVLDIGCGSGFKLLKYFSAYKVTGIDVNETVEFLKNKYPNHRWLSIDEPVSNEPVDMIICSDVIEHVLDPDQLIRKIKSFSPKAVVLSTPDRKLLDLSDYFGPPSNPTHIREWTFHELRDYLSKHFEILEQIIINYDQRTQLTLCRPLSIPRIN